MEEKKQEQHNAFPKLVYIEAVAVERSEPYQEIKMLSVEMVRYMTRHKREKRLVQLEELHQHMQNIVSTGLETLQKYSTS